MRLRFWPLLLLSLLLFSTHSPAAPGKNPRHIDTALSYVGTQEATGHNDGPIVEKFLHSVGRHKGDSWCAAFVSYCLDAAHVQQPSIRSGLAHDFKRSPGMITSEKVLRGATVPPGSLVGWEKGNTIFGHIGFTPAWSGISGTTIEGNTSPPGGRSESAEWNGDGVYIKKRLIQPANYFRIRFFVPVRT